MEQIEKKLLIFYDYSLSKSKESIVFYNNYTYQHSHVQRSVYNEILRNFENYFRDEIETLTNYNDEENKED